MSKRSVLTSALVLMAGATAPALRAGRRGCGRRSRRDRQAGRSSPLASRSALPPGSARSAQGTAVASAAEAIARNPGASGDIRGALILGLVLIESLVIYVLADLADPLLHQAVRRLGRRTPAFGSCRDGTGRGHSACAVFFVGGKRARSFSHAEALRSQSDKRRLSSSQFLRLSSVPDVTSLAGRRSHNPLRISASLREIRQRGSPIRNPVG